jgi:NAD(P)H-dependent FMN reductase
VLKNAIDWVHPEWNRKTAGFVSYGSAMGACSVQQLRLTAIEVQLAPIRSSVHILVNASTETRSTRRLPYSWPFARGYSGPVSMIEAASLKRRVKQ